jgi:hypothetical protein
MAFASGAPDQTRVDQAKRMETLLPDMAYEDRLKVAEVVLSLYGKVAETHPVDRERVRTEVSRELRRLAEEGEQWAARALTLYCCKVCFDRLADHYEPQGHRKVCGVTSPLATEGERVFHRAARVQFYGGSWSLNVYVAQCGVTDLTNGSRGSVPCRKCFQ